MPRWNPLTQSWEPTWEELNSPQYANAVKNIQVAGPSAPARVSVAGPQAPANIARAAVPAFVRIAAQNNQVAQQHQQQLQQQLANQNAANRTILSDNLLPGLPLQDLSKSLNALVGTPGPPKPKTTFHPLNILKGKNPYETQSSNVLTHPEFGNYGGYIAHGQAIPGQPGDAQQQARVAADIWQKNHGFVPVPIRVAATQGPEAAKSLAENIKKQASEVGANKTQQANFFHQLYTPQGPGGPGENKDPLNSNSLNAIKALGGLTGDKEKDANLLRLTADAGYDITPVTRYKFTDTPEYQKLQDEKQNIANKGATGEITPGQQAALEADLKARADKFYQDYSDAFLGALRSKSGFLGAKPNIDQAKSVAMDAVKSTTSPDVLNYVRQEQLSYRDADRQQAQQKSQQDELSKRPSQRLFGKYNGLVNTVGSFIPGIGTGLALGNTAYDVIQSNAAQKTVEEQVKQSSELSTQATQAYIAGDKKRGDQLNARARALQPEINQAVARSALLPGKAEYLTGVGFSLPFTLGAGKIAQAAASVPAKAALAKAAFQQDALRALGQGGKGVAKQAAINIPAAGVLGGIQASAQGQPFASGVIPGAEFGAALSPLGLLGIKPRVAKTPTANLLPLADRAQPGLLQRPLFGRPQEPITLKGQGSPYQAALSSLLSNGRQAIPQGNFGQIFGATVNGQVNPLLALLTGGANHLNAQEIKRLNNLGAELNQSPKPVEPLALGPGRPSAPGLPAPDYRFPVPNKESAALGSRDVPATPGAALRPGEFNPANPEHPLANPLLQALISKTQPAVDAARNQRRGIAAASRELGKPQDYAGGGLDVLGNIKEQAGKTTSTHGTNLPAPFTFDRYTKAGGRNIGFLDKAANRSLNSLAKVSPEAANRIAVFLEDHAKLRANFEQQLPSVEGLKKNEEANFVDAARGKAEPMNDHVSAAVKEWQDFSQRVHPEAVKLGVLKPDQALLDYFPERPTKEFYKSDAYVKLSKKIAKENDISASEASSLLDSLGSDKSIRGPKSGLEYQRQGKIPEPFIRKDKGVVSDYVDEISRRLAEARTLTKEGRFGPAKTHNALEEAITNSGGTPANIQYARKIAKEIVGTAEPKAGAGALGVVRGYQIFRKLGLGALTNITQFPDNTMPIIGGIRSAKAVRAALSKDAEMAKFVRDTDVVDRQVIRQQTERQIGSAGRIATNVGAPGFQQVERGNRTLSAVGGRIYAIDMGRMAADGNKTAVRALQKMNLNVDKIVARGGKLTYDEQVHAARNIVERTQFLLGDANLPLWASSPVGRTLMQYKTYAANQLAFVPREIFSEAAHGNFAPLARWSVATLVLGTAVDEAQYRIRHGVQDTLSGLLGNPKQSDTRDNSLVGRGIRGFNKGGGFGLLSELQNFAPFYKGERGDPLTLQALKEVTGPTGSDLISLINGIGKAVGGDKNPNPLEKLLVGAGIPVFGSQVANSIFPSQSQEIQKEQDKRKAQLRAQFNNLNALSGGDKIGSRQNRVNLSDKEIEALSQTGNFTNDGLFFAKGRASAYKSIEEKFKGDQTKIDDAKRGYDKLNTMEENIYNHVVLAQKANNEQNPITKIGDFKDARNAAVDDSIPGNGSLVSPEIMSAFLKETSGGQNQEAVFTFLENIRRYYGDNPAALPRANQLVQELVDHWQKTYLPAASSQDRPAATEAYTGPSSYLNTGPEAYSAGEATRQFGIDQTTTEQAANLASMDARSRAKLVAQNPGLYAADLQGAVDYTGKRLQQDLIAPSTAKSTIKSLNKLLGGDFTSGGSGGGGGRRKGGRGRKSSSGKSIRITKGRAGKKLSFSKKSTTIPPFVLPKTKKKSLTFQQILKQLS